MRSIGSLCSKSVQHSRSDDAGGAFLAAVVRAGVPAVKFTQKLHQSVVVFQLRQCTACVLHSNKIS